MSARLPPILRSFSPGANVTSLSTTLYHVLRRRRWPNNCRNHRLHPTFPISPQLVAPPHSKAPLVAFPDPSRPTSQRALLRRAPTRLCIHATRLFVRVWRRPHNLLTTTCTPCPPSSATCPALRRRPSYAPTPPPFSPIPPRRDGEYAAAACPPRLHCASPARTPLIHTAAPPIRTE
ncbi:hypothetical protein C8R44DRAFT_865230 [Mycena epipterygia]|nr:hypothetical protein C8R44DRAFT_865230 [Mycena epipterygia]